MRLIDADTLFDEVLLIPAGEFDATIEIISRVYNAPTIDPVKHGYWVGKPLAGYAAVRCSVCNTVFLYNSGKWNYCPNCGADMRGEKDG